MMRRRRPRESRETTAEALEAIDPDSLEDMDRGELLSVARELLAGRKGRSSAPRRVRVDPEEVAASVEDALDYSWQPPERGILRDVAHQVDVARRHLQARRWDDALRVALGVVRGFASRYDPGVDEDGEVASELQESVEVASKALTHVKDRKLRGAVFESLLDLWWADVGHGGVGLADEVPDVFSKHATEPERHRMASHVKARLPKMSDGWSRQTSAHLYLDLAGDELDDDAYLAFCLDNALHMDRVQRFLRLHRPGDAARAAAAVPPHQLTDAADLFVRAGHAPLGVELVRARLGDTHTKNFTDRFRAWLQRHAVATNDLPQARLLAWERFRELPGMSTYASLKGVAKALRTWDDDEKEVLSLLDQKKEHALLTEVHLEERRVADALGKLKGLPRRVPRDWGLDNLKLRVARAAEKQFPEAARDLYLELAQGRIAGKTRAFYAQAAPLLKAAIRLEDKVDSARRRGVLGMLRQRYGGLPALWDELRKAGVRVRP